MTTTADSDKIYPYCHTCGLAVIPALQPPTQAKQIDHDIIEQLSLFRQQIADQETAKVFHMTCIENLVERLNEVEGKVKAIEQQFLEILSHGCCIPVCSKHQGPLEGNG